MTAERGFFVSEHLAEGERRNEHDQRLVTEAAGLKGHLEIPFTTQILASHDCCLAFSILREVSDLLNQPFRKLLELSPLGTFKE